MSEPTRNNHDVESGQARSDDLIKDSGISAFSWPEDLEEFQPPKRRITRKSTFRSLDIQGESWLEKEPGIDQSNIQVGREMLEECQITVTDFDESKLEIHNFDAGEQFLEFLRTGQESWVKHRWINVNGRNWEVIKAIGLQKRLHRFAIDDLISDSRVAKIEWYADHVYIVLTLQKLVNHDQGGEEGDWESENDEVILGSGRAKRRGLLSRIFRRNNVENVHNERRGTLKRTAPKLVTLQNYHGYNNQEGITYMETHSALALKRLGVVTDRVSIFLTADNTVISFSQNSADNLENIVIPQLVEFNTLFRQSSDASVITQGILNAIIDQAVPVTEAYRDAIGSLQLDVLTQPSVKHTSTLYIMTNEIEWIRSSVSPILNIIRTLRDHKNATITEDVRQSNKGQPSEGQSMAGQSRVKISSAAQTYARDAEGKITLIIESLDAIRTSGTTLIDLIFNTVSANQNESIKQLTVVTIIFLPMSFLAAYFAVPFKDFSLSRHNQGLYWGITIPTAVLVVLFLMGDKVKWYFTKRVQQRRISRQRIIRRRKVAVVSARG